MSTREYYEYPVSTPDLVEVVEVVAVHVELTLRIRAYTHNAHRRCTARGAVQTWERIRTHVAQRQAGRGGGTGRAAREVELAVGHSWVVRVPMSTDGYSPVLTHRACGTRG